MRSSPRSRGASSLRPSSIPIRRSCRSISRDRRSALSGRTGMATITGSSGTRRGAGERMSANASRIALAGLGPIGSRLAKALDQGIDGLELAAVSAQNIDKHRDWLGKLNRKPAVMPIDALADAADIVVECAPSKLVRAIVAPVVSRGKIAVVLSVGALLENDDLIALAKVHGGQIVVPTGALIGLDAVTAAAARGGAPPLGGNWCRKSRSEAFLARLISSSARSRSITLSSR